MGEGGKGKRWRNGMLRSFFKGGGGEDGRGRGSSGEVCVLDLIVVVLLLGLERLEGLERFGV